MGRGIVVVHAAPKSTHPKRENVGFDGVASTTGGRSLERNASDTPNLKPRLNAKRQPEDRG